MAQFYRVWSTYDLKRNQGCEDVEQALESILRMGWELLSVGYDQQGLPQTWVFRGGH